MCIKIWYRHYERSLCDLVISTYFYTAFSRGGDHL